MSGGTPLSHVLVGGDEQQMSELRSLLAKWGMTVGALNFGDSCPTILACDAVILRGECDRYRDADPGPLPDGPGGAAGPAAPLIFINGDGVPRDDLPAAWIVLNHIDPDGDNLLLALQMAQARADAWRGQIVVQPEQTRVATDVRDGDSYGHFLGHELRSPLTAIKTALETLAAETQDPDLERRLDAVDGKLVAIALRNVQRLQQTVDWSQDLLVANEAAARPRRREMTLAEVADRLRCHGEIGVDASLAGFVLLTDPELLETLTDQMVRAIAMAGGGAELSLRFAPDAVAHHRLKLTVAGPLTAGRRTGRMSRRTRLIGAETEHGPIDDLARLARFLVAPSLIQALDGTLTTAVNDDGWSQLVLTFAGQPAPALSS